MTISPENQTNWKQQVLSHYESTQLSPEKTQKLAQLLKSVPLNPVTTPISLSTKTKTALKKLHTSGLGYFATAAAAAAFTFFTAGGFENANDPIDELTTVGTRAYPPDFDLEGDATAFQDIVKELMPNESFAAEIPQHLRAKFSPAEGRFFSWAGEAGVRIRMVRSGLASTAQDNATLYIVRLPKHVESKFPLGKTTKKIAGTFGRDKRVKTWREGKFGYALVQYVATNEGNPSLEEP
jgi:hypothetical protein